MIGLDAASKGQKSGGRLVYEMRDFSAFDKVKVLIPQNCFCGFEDTIPGLASEKLPNPRTLGQNVGKPIDLPVLNRGILYIHNI